MKSLSVLSFYLLCVCPVFSQEDSLTKQDQDKYFKKNIVKYDTLRGRHFKEFVRPNKKRSIVNSSFNEKNTKAPTFKKKCKKLVLNSERQDCFKNEFYEILRKKFRPPFSYYDKGQSIFMLIQFTINEVGNIENIKFSKSNDQIGKVEKEVKRVLLKFPEIEPAMKEMKEISVTYHFPFRIKIW